MIDLAISEDVSSGGETIILTNNGRTLRAPRWPQDCEFQLVAFAPSAKTCEVVWAEQLTQDIAIALAVLDEAQAIRGKKPEWYRRLARYANGAASTG